MNNEKPKIDFSGLREAFPDAIMGRGRRIGDYLIIWDEDTGESHLYYKGQKVASQYKE